MRYRGGMSIYDLILNTLVFKFRHSPVNISHLSFSGWRVLQVETVTCWIRLQDLRRDYMQGRDNSTSASSPDCTQILYPSWRIINNSPELSWSSSWQNELWVIIISFMIFYIRKPSQMKSLRWYLLIANDQWEWNIRITSAVQSVKIWGGSL